MDVICILQIILCSILTFDSELDSSETLNPCLLIFAKFSGSVVVSGIAIEFTPIILL
jgi:hypothetical protein